MAKSAGQRTAASIACTDGTPADDLVINGVEYVAVFQELAAILSSELGDVVGSVAAHRTEVVAALDFMFTGS